VIPSILAAALREALADLSADDLERALDALVTVASVGQTMLTRRGLVTA
jgi:hypothetical protein